MSFPKNAVNNQVYSKNGKHFRYNASKNSWTIGRTIESYSDFDVTTTSPLVGDTLTWNGSKIVPEELRLVPRLLSTIGDLPSSNNTIGDIALVSENHRVYMWDSYAWQEIATANNYPVINAYPPQNLYIELNTAPVTLTLDASDPEEMPISWSYSIISGSLGGNTVSITDNIATITPSTDPDDVNNSFVIRFTATDGILVDTARTGVTLVVIGPNAWDISYLTPTYSNTFYNLGATINTLSGPYTLSYFGLINHFFYDPTGTKFFIQRETNAGSNRIQVYNLNTPYNFDTISSITEHTISTSSESREFSFNSDGTKFYLSIKETLYQIDVATPWSIPANLGSPSATLSSFVSIRSFSWSSDGYILVIHDAVNSTIHYKYTLSTAWDINTATLSNTYNIPTSPNLRGNIGLGDRVRISPDGTKLFFRIYSSNATGAIPPTNFLITVPMNIPWDLNSLNYYSAISQDLSEMVYDPPNTDGSFNFSADGSKLLLHSSNSSYLRIDQYNLLEAWNHASIDWTEKRYISEGNHNLIDAVGQGGVPNRFTISPDGLSLYATTDTNEGLAHYELEYPWNITSRKLMSSISFQSGDAVLDEGITIAGDKSRLYRLGSGETLTQIMLDEFGEPIDDYRKQNGYMNSNYGFPNSRTPLWVTETTDVMDQWFSEDGLDWIVAYNRGLSKFRLSTPWDITTAKNAVNTFTEVTSVMGSITAIHMSPDGYNLYLRRVDDAIEHWYTTEAWNFNDVKFKSIAYCENLGTNYSAIQFDPTGTYLYTSQYAGKVIQAKTNTPWHINELIVVDTFNTGASNTQAVYLSSDGTKMYELLYSGYINEFILSTPYMVSTAVLNFTVDIELMADAVVLGYGDASCVNMKITEDGTTILVFGLQTDKLQQWEMTTPWDLSTLTWVGITEPVSYGMSEAAIQSYGIETNPEKTKIWVGQAATGIVEFPLITPGDFCNFSKYKAGFITGNSLGLGVGPITSLNVYDNGTTLYIGVSDDVYKIELSDPSNFNTASITQTYLSVGAILFNARFTPDGSRLYFSNNTASLRWYNLSVPFDPSPSSNGGSFNTITMTGYATAFEFNSDGTELYFLGDADNKLRKHILQTPYQIESRTADILVTDNTISNAVAYVGMRLSPDASKIFYVDNNDIAWLETNPPGDLSTVYNGLETYNNRNTISFVAPFVPTTDGGVQAVTFNPDGTKFYTLGTTSDSVREFTMTTRWDITTASFTAESGSLVTLYGLPNVNWENVKFKPDGTKMYLMAVGIIYEVDITTPWDLTTLVYSSKTITLPNASSLNPKDINFTPDGNNIIVLDSTSNQYCYITYPIV